MFAVKVFIPLVLMYITRCEAVATILASGLCEVNVESRKECGWAGITKAQCESRGCCFNSNFVKSKWCFHKAKANNQCSVNPESRKECGWPGITKEQCESKPGCCFNNRTPGMKWCYYERIVRDIPKRQFSGSCEVNVESRINCGWGGITRQQCESRGCCFNSNFIHSNWCFYKDISNSRCSVNPENRKECGWAGITKEQCESKPGCCFNNKTPGMKWCYYERIIRDKPNKQVTGSCEVNVESRVNCGWAGITRQQCESRGCCFNSNFVHSSWCFYKDTTNSRCSINPENRELCGWAGITKEQCEAKPGCCFNNKTPGTKWCYHERIIKEHFGGICHRDFKKLGCFRRDWSQLTDLLVTDLDPTHPNFTVPMNWDNFELGLHSLACRCRQKAKGHYKYFALGFHGECVAGKDNTAIEKLMAEDTKSDHGCINGQFSDCDKKHKKECIGLVDYDFIYEITYPK